VSVLTVLEKAGYLVIWVQSGEKAVETVRATANLDLILIDFNLDSGMDGAQAAGIISAFSDLPVIFLYSPSEENNYKIGEIPCYGYLLKGSGGYIIQSAVETALKLFNKCQSFEKKITILKNKENLLNEAQRLAHIGHWHWELTEKALYWSSEIYNIFGVNPETFMVSAENFEKLIHPDDLKQFLEQRQYMLDHELDKEIEHRIIRNGGEIRHVIERAKVIRSENGQAISVMGTVQDITERRLAEETIKKQLSEKETLLKEVHHRIKNNIGSIEGLLSMQIKSLVNPETVSVLQDTIGRVKSMGILYEKLLISDEYKECPAKNYIETLVDSILALFSDSRITIEKKIGDFNLVSKKLFAVGIIINELLTNIMKYAFTNNSNRQITIALEKVKKRVTLTVQDNGKGLPEGFNMDSAQGFGLKLVRMLCEQLDGTFTTQNHKGVRSILVFRI